eukprot:3995685-Prymnesium_polylepis.1
MSCNLPTGSRLEMRTPMLPMMYVDTKREPESTTEAKSNWGPVSSVGMVPNPVRAVTAHHKP